MRNLLPTLRLPPSLSEPVLRAKFGGLPWGLPSTHWPLCRECGEPMSCLAQVPVRGHLDQADPFAGRADLSDKVLHLFTCERPTICSFWEPDAGANAAFFLACEALQAPGLAPSAPGTPVLPEVWIEGWVAHGDPVPDELAASFTDSGLFYALPEAMQFPHDFEPALQTKLGGVPYWTGNGPMGPPQMPFRFLMQIDKFLMIEETEGGYVDLANFCSDGTGFVFVDVDRAELPSLLLINR